MYILDIVQEELREPQHSPHASRGTEVPPICDYYYFLVGLFNKDSISDAHEWLKTREGNEALEEHAGEAMLVSRKKIVGHGYTWKEAYEIAIKNGIHPHACISVKIPRGLFTL